MFQNGLAAAPSTWFTYCLGRGSAVEVAWGFLGENDSDL